MTTLETGSGYFNPHLPVNVQDRPARAAGYQESADQSTHGYGRAKVFLHQADIRLACLRGSAMQNSLTPIQHPAPGGSAGLLSMAVRISDKRSGDDIRLSLVRTLTDLFRLRKVSFFDIAPGPPPRLNESLRALIATSSQRVKPIVAGLGERGIVPQGILGECLQTRNMAIGTGPGGACRYGFPIADDRGVFELVGLDFLAEPPGDFAVLGAIMKLYGNVLSLVREKDMDTLTGVLNRRAFDARLASVMSAASKQPPSLAYWLAMIDVDHFKRINDEFGHVLGDEVLLLVARRILQSFRTIDGVYRYGGEEFAVLIAPCDETAAIAAVERCRAEIADSKFPQVGQVTISAGLTVIDHYEHISNAVGRADRALYTAKHNGRNRVVPYSLIRGSAKPQLEAGHDLELF